ncbi:MAG: hypothetical protein WC246_00095 [Candidatus Paceibacterota bacterium]
MRVQKILPPTITYAPEANKTATILSTIGDFGVECCDLAMAVLIAGYGASPARVAIVKDRMHNRRICAQHDHAHTRQCMRRYRAMVKKLEEQNLIKKETRKKKLFLCLTQQGKNYLTKIRRHEQAVQSHKTQTYARARWILIVFDIPEGKRDKRAWLRATLITMEFIMIQKSVWMGKLILPRSFIDDLREQEIHTYVQILEITKRGTIECVGRKTACTAIAQ